MLHPRAVHGDAEALALLTATAPELTINEWGYIITDEHGMTSMPGVFAGGDIVTGAATVILAAGAGRAAGMAIDKFLKDGGLCVTRPRARRVTLFQLPSS